MVSRILRLSAPALLAAVLLVSSFCPAQARILRPGGSHGGPMVQEWVIEGGLVEPYGDLADPYYTTVKGLEAGGGFDVGLRYRSYVLPGFAVSPTFHFVKFGTFQGASDPELPNDYGFEVRTKIFRYGLDLQKFLGPDRSPVQPYLSGGLALSHNVYVDYSPGWGEYSTGESNLEFAVGGGLKLQNMELSLIYHVNRFDSSQLPPATEVMDYNWDYLSVRLGFGFEVR